MNTKFWNVKHDGQKSRIDLFGYVGGSKDWNDGFNEKEFLNELRTIPSENALDISVNSFGGSVYTALSIYALLKAHKGEITFRIDGAAMSAATIITSVPGAKVIMPRGSMMMIHKVSSIAVGDADDMRKAADDVEKLEKNIVDIYVEKTGRDAKEIQKKIDAESYFTADEAVEFGLADEVDETVTVENKVVGDVVMLNGLEANAEFLKRAPKSYFKVAEPKASAIDEEVHEMNFEKLNAEHPELVQQIRNEALAEGAQNERARIQAIEEIAMPGHAELVNAAKWDGITTAEMLAVQMLKAEKQKAAQMLQARAEDAQTLAEVTPAENKGIDPKADAKAQEEAQMQAIVEAGRRGFVQAQ